MRQERRKRLRAEKRGRAFFQEEVRARQRICMENTEVGVESKTLFDVSKRETYRQGGLRIENTA